MNTQISIRKANLKDLDRISELGLEHDKYEHSLNNSVKVSSFKKYEEITKRAMHNPAFVFFLAEENKNIVGWINCSIDVRGNQKLGVFHDIIITKSERGKGIGTKLMKAMFNYFKTKNCSSVKSFVHTKNKNALKFYENLGFQAEEGYHIRKELK